MVDIASIAQAQAPPRKAVEAAAPKQVRKAAEPPSTPPPGAEPISFSDEGAPQSSVVSAPKPKNIANVPPSTSGNISQIVSEVNSNLTLINADLAIEVDRELKQVIFKVVDLETGETIKQIPSEEMIRIAKKLNEMIENYSSRSSSSLHLLMDSSSFA